jgi:hypothetical protein
VEGQAYHEQLQALGVGVKAKTNIPFILANQAQDKPPYPFYAYAPTALKRVANIKQSERRINEDAGEPEIVEIIAEQHEMTLSVSCVSDTVFEALELAEKLKAWLKDTGYAYLSRNEIVVVKCTDTSQRDVYIINGYERRWTFDVVLRLGRNTERLIPLIERTVIQEGVIIK